MADDERRGEIEAARTSWVCDVCGWSATFDEPMTTVYCVACLHGGRGADVRCRLTFPLDRVRDARGDDGPTCNCDNLFGTRRAHADDCPLARSPQAEDHEAGVAAIIGRYARTGESRAAREVLAYLDRVRDARGGDGAGHWECNVEHDGEHDEHSCRFVSQSPQGEDHEAGIEAAYDAADACFPSSAQGRWLRPAVEAAVAAYLAHVSPSRDGSTVAVEDVEKLRAALQEAVAVIGHSRVDTIGARQVHSAQVGVKTVERWRGLLAEFSPASTGDREAER